VDADQGRLCVTGGHRGRPRTRVGAQRRSATLLLLPILVAACGDQAPPSVQVGEYVRYPEREVLGLSETQRGSLAVLTGLGLAVARGEVAGLGEARMERMERELLVETLVDEETLRRSSVGDDVLRARYEVSPSWQLQVRHIVFLAERTASDSARTLAREAAEAALARVEAGEDFPGLAGELSQEPGAAERGGLLRPAREGDWVPEFWRAAAALEPGEVSGVVESTYGYHVIRLERKDMVPFADVRDRVAREVAGMLGRPEREAAREALVEEVSGGLSVVDGALTRLRHTELGSEPLATWSGGALRPEAFRRWLAGREGPEIVDPFTASDAELAAALRGAAVDEALVAMALDRGIRIPDSESEALRLSWQRQVAGWAQVLGFREGMTPQEVASAARAALGASGQDAAIARDQILQVRPLVSTAYAVQVSPPQ
jgi:hypothetical protein